MHCKKFEKLDSKPDPDVLCLPLVSTLQPQRQSQQPPQAQPQSQGSVSAPLYNTMMISQPGQPNVLQISTSLPQNNTQQGTAVATFTQDRQIR